MNSFSVGAMVRFGWETFKKRPWFFVGAFLLLTVISGIASEMSGAVDKAQGSGLVFLAVISMAIGIMVSIYVKMGTINFLLRANDSPETVEISDLWAPNPLWRFIVANVVVAFIVIVGLILLIVPGIIWSLRYMFVPYLVMDKRLDVAAALKESRRITDGHKWQLLLLALALVGINILGLLCLIVGLFVSIPVSALACVHAYRTLSAISRGVSV